MAQLTVGLDIGTSAVRAAEIDVGHARPVLHTYGQVGLPPGSLVDGEIRDISAVTEAIVKLWKNGQFSSNSVIVGIAGLRAITREIDLPYVPDDEVDSAVRFQSEEVIPFPPDQTILSSQVLADYTSSEGDKMRRVLVAAAHVDLVNAVIDAVEKAGLTVEGVDLISSALVRAIGGQEASEQPEAIVSVGAGLTVVVVHQQGRPQFVRTIGSGGNATTAVCVGRSRPPDIRCRGRQTADRRIQCPDTGGRARRTVKHDRVGRRDPQLDSVLRLAARPAARLTCPGHRRWLGALRLAADAGSPGSTARHDCVAAHPPRYIPIGSERRAGRRGRTRAGHTHRTRPPRAGQGGQEVQPHPARGRQADEDEEGAGTDPSSQRGRARPAGPVRWLEVLPGAQRAEHGGRHFSRISPPSTHRSPSTTWSSPPTAPIRRGKTDVRPFSTRPSTGRWH